MNNFSLKLIILFSIIFIPAFGKTSDGQWKQYIYTDGLSSNYIFDVEKDDKLRIWVGTQNGITLIDGLNITKYGVADGLPAANIIKIISYKDQIFAATSNQGIYTLKNNMFQKVDFVKGTDVFSMEKVSDKVFISTSIENIMYNGTKTSFMGRGFPNVKVRDVFTDGDKNWFVYNDHIIFEKNKGFGTEKIPFSASDVIIQAYLIDGYKEYFGTNKGLWSRIDKGKVQLLSNINVLSLEKLNDNNIIIGSKRGLYSLNENIVNKITPEITDTKKLAKTAIRDIEIISENEIWYSTFGMGLFLHDPGTFVTIGKKSGLDVGGMIYDMVSYKNKVYVATRNGLFVYFDGEIQNHLTKSNGLPSNTILDMDVDFDGVLWLATTNGLSKYAGNSFKNYGRKDGLPAKLVTAVHVDKNDNSKIWVGSERSGLTRFDKKGFFTFAKQDGLPSNSIRDITQSDDGSLIIACYNAGVVKFDNDKFKLFDNGLDDKRVILVTVGPDEQIWTGTESAGLAILKDNNTFKMIRDSDGLGHNEMFSLTYDGSNVWAGTFGGGVSCFNEGIWFTLRESDGLNSNTIGAVILLEDNKVLVGGNNGLSILSLKKEAFKLSISNILTPSEELLFNKDINPISGIIKDRFLISLNPMIYNPTGAKIKFRSRVISNNSNVGEWSNLESSSQISYVPETVGAYNLEIQAIDNRISFSEVLSIPFKLGRVWYLDPITAVPFWGSIILLIGFSSITYINFRKKSIEAQELRDAEIKRQQAEMEEAREFQQAMLPKEMPITDEYEMVGFQKTATEVGGDFYDFVQKDDGRWIGICGDATGHGLTSGNVVSITKTAMSSLVNEDPVPTLDSLNKTLLKMNIGLNRMCLNIANLGEDSIRFSSAGMPPAYYFSAKKDEVEEVLVGALPLGSFKSAIHMEQEIKFKDKGDIFVMMSDGLPEAENSEGEMVGYERTLELIRSMSNKSAEEIKNGLVEMCDEWLGNTAELQDDMTFVIIKKK